MSNIDPFEKYAKSLSSYQNVQIRKTMDELGLKRTDALFHIMAALDYYRILYERVPEQIKLAGDNALQAVNEAARIQGEREFAVARNALAEEVVSTARKMNMSRDRDVMWLFSMVSIALALVVMLGAYFLGRSNANDKYRASTAEAVTWFQSPDGQYARFLDEHGVLRALQVCQAQKRTIAIGVKKVECGTMRAGMRDVTQSRPLPDLSVPPVRPRSDDLPPWERYENGSAG